MVKGIDKLVAGPLALKGDALDAQRAEVIEQLMMASADSLPRNEVYNFAVGLWEPIAVDVYNKGNLNETYKKLLSEIFDLCSWINTEALTPNTEHHGAAHVVGAIAAHFLGKSDVAVSSLKIAMKMPVATTSWVGAAETLIRVYVDNRQFDAALEIVHEILKHHPQNAYAQRMLEAHRIDEANAARAKTSTTSPALVSDMDFSHVNASNYAEIAQKMSQDFQQQVSSLMSGPMDHHQKMVQMQRMQAEFQANMQKLVSRLSA